jgi:hypothetical protein
MKLLTSSEFTNFHLISIIGELAILPSKMVFILVVGALKLFVVLDS